MVTLCYLSIYRLYMLWYQKCQRLNTLWQNILQKMIVKRLDWCMEAYNHEVVIHWPRRYSVRSHFVGSKVQSYCWIQEVARINTKYQIISPFLNRMFWTGTTLQHKNHSGMFLFTDPEVCVTAFVICVCAGQNSIYLINTNYSARWLSQWLFYNAWGRTQSKLKCLVILWYSVEQRAS